MAKVHEQFLLDIGGTDYRFKAPKIAGIISAMVDMRGKPEMEQQQILLGAQAKWLAKGLGQDQWKDIQKRLDNEEETLDWPDLVEAFNEAMSDSAKRPISSSSDSSTPSQETTQSEGVASDTASIFGS